MIDPAAVELTTLTTPFDAFVDAQPRSVFVRDRAQRYARNPWYNLADL